MTYLFLYQKEIFYVCQCLIGLSNLYSHTNYKTLLLVYHDLPTTSYLDPNDLAFTPDSIKNTRIINWYVLLGDDLDNLL